jgi:2-succinyl-5-enolpyruvyl-6-hydroxy-3-cyclohexene-1-carboxylate synthase
MSLDFRNTNTLWASVLVTTLARLGLRAAVVSPGSRSTPLTLALAHQSEIEAIPVLDERSAAFFALGLARRTGRPVALVCTSGTAGANYYPAVIEARESRIPLLVITADRPPELRDCASGQTIDQQRLFGRFPTWYAEVAVPMGTVEMLAYLRQTLVQAWGRSLLPVAGPVHLNCPFRDPLAPIADSSVDHLQPLVNDGFFAAVGLASAPGGGVTGLASDVTSAVLTPSRLPWAEWQGCDRGVLIAGPAQPTDPVAYCKAVARLALALGWPVLAEGLSPLRNWADLNPYLITTYEVALGDPDWALDLAPDQVLQLGPLPTSKTLRQWIQTTQPRRWVVDPLGANLDPLHGPAIPLPLALETLAAMTPEPTVSTPYTDHWISRDRTLRQRLDGALEVLAEPFEGKVVWLLAQCLPHHTPLVIANSMPIRDVEWFWPPNQRGIRPYCNRGANGIDGTLSTAMGIAHGGPPTVLVTGDLSLLHDTNGWLSVPRLQGHLTVIAINNRGGGIFERLPIATTTPPNLFEDFFATPQTVDLNHLCAAYGVSYERVDTWDQLVASVGSLPQRGVRLLELRCDRQQSHRRRQQILSSPPPGASGQ